MAVPFDPDRCTVPPIVRIGPAPLLGDSTVPEPPEEIIDCLATLTPFVDDLGCIPLTVRGGDAATFPVRTTSATVGGLTLRIIPGPGCAYDFDLDLALPCPPLTAPARPRPVAAMAYSSDSTGTLAVTITPGPGCAYDFAATLAAVSPGLIALTEPAGLTARDQLTLGSGFVTLHRLDKRTGQLVPTQTHIKTYNAKLEPVAGSALTRLLVVDGALVASGPTSRLCYTRISGRVRGNPGVPDLAAGASVTITGYWSGTDYGTFPADDGTYVADVEVDTAVEGFTPKFLVTATHPSPRFAPSVPVDSGIVIECGSVAAPDAFLLAAPEHYYWHWDCVYPARYALSYVIPGVGAGVALMNLASFAQREDCLDITTRATTGCPTPIAAQVRIVIGPSLTFNVVLAGVFDHDDGAGHAIYCPTMLPCAEYTGGTPDLGAGGGKVGPGDIPSRDFAPPGAALEIHSCPSATSLFSATITFPVSDNAVFGTGTATMLVYEED